MTLVAQDLSIEPHVMVPGEPPAEQGDIVFVAENDDVTARLRLPDGSFAPVPPSEEEEQEDAPSVEALFEDVTGELSKLREQLQVALAKRGIPDEKRRAIEKRVKEIDRVLHAAAVRQAGEVDLAPVLTHPPSPRQLRAPGRREVVLRRARERMERSRYMFPDPKLVLGGLAALLGEDAMDDVRETELRILHYLAGGNIQRDGMLIAQSLRRIVSTGRLALNEASTEDETRSVNAARHGIRCFLEVARGRR